MGFKNTNTFLFTYYKFIYVYQILPWLDVTNDTFFPPIYIHTSSSYLVLMIFEDSIWETFNRRQREKSEWVIITSPWTCVGGQYPDRVRGGICILELENMGDMF